MKTRISKNFHVPLHSLSSMKTATWGGGGGGGDWGYLELGPGTPAMVTPRSKYTHSGHNTQRIFAPPPKKRGTPVRGGGGTGVKIQKIIG